MLIGPLKGRAYRISESINETVRHGLAHPEIGEAAVSGLRDAA